MRRHLVFVGPTGFAGAGRAMVQYALVSKTHGLGDVTLVSQRAPFSLRNYPALTSSWVKSEPLTSAAIGEGKAVSSPDILAHLQLAESIVKKILQRARSRSIEVVIWAHYLYPYASAASLARRALKRSGRRVQLLITPCGSDVWEIAPQIASVRGAYIDDLDASEFVFYSRRFKSEFENDFQRTPPSRVIPPPIDTERFRPNGAARSAFREELGIRPHELVLVSHSNMRPVKRVDSIVQSARVLASDRSERVWLMIAGPGKSGVETESNLRIAYLGLQPDVSKLLSASDIYVNLSAHDSFNIALAEAMASGVKVVSTDAPGVFDFFSTTQFDGALLPTGGGDLPALAAGAAKAIASESPAQYSQRNVRVIEEHFGEAVVAQALRALLDELSESEPTSAGS